LLGYSSSRVADARVAAALASTPWRGEPSASLPGTTGAIYALGEATAARDGDVSLVLHGRIDRRDGWDADVAATLTGPDACLALIEAYRRDGEDFVDRLIGDFALILVDEHNQSMLATRDWMGTRPLFWGQNENGVAFASEPAQVLVLLDAPYQLDEDVLEEYARMGDPPLDATFALGVRAVMPGEQIIATTGVKVRANRVVPRFLPIKVSRASAVETLRERLDTAVSRRTTGARRLGALISGGMDSTSVAATAASLAERGAGPALVASFTTAYPGLSECDETAYASTVAERWSVAWHPVPIRSDDFHEWPEIGFGYHFGPTFPTFAIFPKLFAMARSKSVDVLLTGEAGDEWFAQRNSALRLSILRGDVRGIMAWTLAGARPNLRTTASQIYRGLEGRLVRGTRAEAYFEDIPYFWIRYALEQEEREAMRHGIRAEFPFADRDLAAYLVGMRPSVRALPRMNKRILRQAMAGLLPESVLLRRGKTRLDPWLAAALELQTETSGPPPLSLSARRYAEAWREGLPRHLERVGMAPPLLLGERVN